MNLGSQQQWFARNSKVSSWNGGVWNVVLTGVEGASPDHCSNVNGVPMANVAQTPLVAEKPCVVRRVLFCLLSILFVDAHNNCCDGLH